MLDLGTRLAMQRLGANSSPRANDNTDQSEALSTRADQESGAEAQNLEASSASIIQAAIPLFYDILLSTKIILMHPKYKIFFVYY